MSFVDGINRLIALFVDVCRQLGRGRIWLFLLAYFFVAWVVLFAHYKFTSPMFYSAVAAWTELIDSQRATGFTHYQGHFLLLPFFFDWGKLLLSVLLEGLIFGSAAVLFYEQFVRVDEDDRFRFGQVARLWVHLVLALVIMNAVILAVNFGLGKLLRPVLEYSPRRQLAYHWVGLPFIYICIVACFFYLVPSIAVYGENIIDGLRRTFRVFRDNPMTTIVMAGLVLAAPIIISNLVSSPETIVERFKPDLVYYLLLAGLVAEAVAGFFWMGMSVRLLVDQEE